MLRFWKSAVKPLLDAVAPGVIVEVGAAEGGNTINLLDYAEEANAVVHVIEPEPRFDPAKLAERYGERFRLHEEKSLNALPRIGDPDVVLLDGDHNWYTVIHELRLLAKTATRDKRPYPLTLLHDVDWPYGRRDLYYDPEAIPAGQRQPFRIGGVVPDIGEPQDALGLNSRFANAIYEHDVKNGVRTAVEDFIAESRRSFRFETVPGFHGLGILASADRLRRNADLRQLIDDLAAPHFLAEQCRALEEDRIRETIESLRLRSKIHDRTGQLDEALDARRQLEAREADASKRLGEAQVDGRKVVRELSKRTDELDSTLERLQRVERALAKESEETAKARRETAKARESGAKKEQMIERRDESLARHSEAIRRRNDALDAVGAELAEIRSRIVGAADSRSWRVGRALGRALRLLRLRRDRGADALRGLEKRLEKLESDVGKRPPGIGRKPSRTDTGESSETGTTEKSSPSDPAVVPAQSPDPPPQAPIEALDVPEKSADRVFAGDAVADALVAAEAKRENGGPPDAGTRRLHNSAELGLGASAETEDIAAARREADRAAASSTTESMARVDAILSAFRNGLAEEWLAADEATNKRFRRDLGSAKRTFGPKVMIGTLSAGENELDACRQSVARQTYPRCEHIVLSDLARGEALPTLIDRFAESDCELLVKLDADTVLLDPDFIKRIVEVFETDGELGVMQAAVLDYYSGGPMQGVNAYRRRADWAIARPGLGIGELRPEDTSRGNGGSRRLVCWAPFVRSAIHSPDPAPEQAFRFGIHRGLKVHSPASDKLAAEQTTYLEKTWEHFLRRRDRRLGLACLGFELALAGECGIDHVDVSKPALEQSFREFAELDARALEIMVRERRAQRPDSPDAERFKRSRRNLLWRSAAGIRSVLFPLPHFGVFGGVNRFFELAQALQDLGVECAIARMPPRDNTQYRQLPSSRDEYPEVVTLEYPEALARSWDVVLCGDCTSGAMLTLPLFHARMNAAYLLNGWSRRRANVEQLRLVEPDLVVAASSYSARFYSDLAPVTIPGGIDLARFNPDGGKGGFADDRDPGAIKIVAYPGRQKPNKGFDIVVEACRILDQAGVPIELHIYDQGPIEVSFPCRFHSGLSREDLPQLLRQMDVMVSAERDAGWSNPTAEAMACGVPVVCTKAGTTDFAIDGETAMVVPVDSPEALAAAIRRVIEDPEGARDRCAAGLELIGQFGWPGVARRLLEVFDDTRLDGRRRQSLNRKALKRLRSLAAEPTGTQPGVPV